MTQKDFFEIYKYPHSFSRLDKDPQGWFPRWNTELLLPKVKNKKIVVELGSWLGRSTREWLSNSDAQVICIDTWGGSKEHIGNKKLTTLYDTFLSNQEEWKDRVFPVRMNTVKGMAEVFKYGLEPDFIYIDASHQYEDVYTDVSLAYNYFPNAFICGDDWNWHNRTQGRRATVQEAVKEFCKNNNLKYINNRWAWYLEK
jgi:hypothetical protein